MSSYEPHRTEKLAASLVAIVCAVAPSIAASQTELEFPANDEAEPILDAIAAAEIRGGPRSAELISPYTELALFYEEASDHELALAGHADVHVHRRAPYLARDPEFVHDGGGRQPQVVQCGSGDQRRHVDRDGDRGDVRR